MAHIIVFGNWKGGCGKTTTAMHVITTLLNLGFSVGSIDADVNQGSLSKYIANRKTFVSKHDANLKIPEHVTLINMKYDADAKEKNLDAIYKQEEENFLNSLKMVEDNDFVIIDTPGSKGVTSSLVHSYANTIITPINDSYMDVALLGDINAEDLSPEKAGPYSNMIWQQKLEKASRDGSQINWIVIRNRLSSLDAINKRNILYSLEKLSKKLGFVLSPGFSERVIFRELFLKGLTLHDAGSVGEEVRMSTSVIAAKMELRNLIKSLKVQELSDRIEKE